MINNYKNHATNERTYLVWIRCSISFITFGFIVEKFERFITSISQTDLTHLFATKLVGLALFMLAIFLFF